MPYVCVCVCFLNTYVNFLGFVKAGLEHVSLLVSTQW